MANRRLLWLILVTLAVAAVLPFWVSAYIIGILTIAYYFSVFAMSWDLLFGFAGEVNFGPTFLLGLGAYGTGILNSEFNWPLWASIIAGTAAAVLGGLVMALPALRLRGPYFGLTTLVAVLLLRQVIVIFAGVTGGEIGLTLADVLSIDETTNYYYAFVYMVVIGGILFFLSRSSVGLILQASGQDAIEAAALGFNVT